MLLPIAQLLNEERLARVHATLRQAPFVDGKSTAAGSAVRVKNNLQVPGQAPEAKLACGVVLEALRGNPQFQSATFPAAMTPPSFCKYQPGMAYGDHIDSPVMGGAPHLRCDIAVTIALVDANTYVGGELVIDTAGVPQRWKGNAGDCILYPADTLHRVEPVTGGERLVAIFWVQSLIRVPGQRRILFDIAEGLGYLEREAPPSPYVEGIRRSYVNLIRL